MRLNISHRTVYRYARPVRLQAHRLLLRPRGNHDLRILAHDLRCTPDADVTWTQDVFGNLIATAVFPGPVVDLTIASRLTVETSADSWPILRIDPAAHLYPFAMAPDELVDLGALAQPDPFDPVVNAWARGFIRSTPTDTLSLLKDINAGVLAAATYRIRDEEGTQSAAETLALASGSCRDLAALLIAAVRSLGFGARAVSGYLFDPEGVEASDTTHAWAEIYLPGAGLIPVAVGRCNAQVMPVAGHFVGDPEDFLEMRVHVAVKPIG